MTFNSNQEQYKGSIWNPFVPTKKDIARTDELASKNPVIAGLSGLLPFADTIYLNRTSNHIKIGIYFSIFLIPIMFAFLSDIRKSPENVETFDEFTDKITRKYIPIMTGLYVVSSIASMAENARAVTLARKRQSENNL